MPLKMPFQPLRIQKGRRQPRLSLFLQRHEIHTVREKCLFVSAETLTFEVASTACQGMGSSMATIDTDDLVWQLGGGPSNACVDWT